MRCQHLGRHDLRAAKAAMWPTTKPARKLTTAPMRMQGAYIKRGRNLVFMRSAMILRGFVHVWVRSFMSM